MKALIPFFRAILFLKALILFFEAMFQILKALFDYLEEGVQRTSGIKGMCFGVEAH